VGVCLRVCVEGGGGGEGERMCVLYMCERERELCMCVRVREQWRESEGMCLSERESVCVFVCT